MLEPEPPEAAAAFDWTESLVKLCVEVLNSGADDESTVLRLVADRTHPQRHWARKLLAYWRRNGIPYDKATETFRLTIECFGFSDELLSHAQEVFDAIRRGWKQGDQHHPDEEEDPGEAARSSVMTGLERARKLLLQVTGRQVACGHDSDGFALRSGFLPTVEPGQSPADPPALVPTAGEVKVTWWHGGQRYSADQRDEVIVTDEDHAFIQTFLKTVGPKATGDIESMDGCSNPSRAAKHIETSYDGRFAKHIRRPGRIGRGTGYLMVVKPVT
jgi:hypothetical protein